MDGSHFDHLSRSLAGRGPRRTLLRLLAGGALGLTIWPQTEPAQLVAAKNCKKIKDKKKRKKCKKKNAGTSPPPVSVLTYQCPGPVEAFVFTSSPGATRLAQTFTAAQSGSLLQIQFEVLKTAGSTGDYLVELLATANDIPSNTVLATVAIPNASVPDGTSTLTASFAGPPLVAATAYAAAIRRPGGNQLEPGARTGNDCTGRAFLQNPSGTGAFTEIVDANLVTADLVIAVTVLT